MVYGAQNIYFAQLMDPNTTHFSMNAVRFLVGKYPFMMGGLVGAALAMYHTVSKENRDAVKGLYVGAAATSFLTGITEPIEFTFLFLSPMLFGIHTVLAGISFTLCHMWNIAVGTTFSDGLIDFMMFGPLQGISKTHWPRLIVLIIIYFVVYYFLFRFFIQKKDVKIPGRDGATNAKLYSKEDYLKKKSEEGKPVDLVSPVILKGLGGKSNILDLDNCATRLRITVEDPDKVDEATLKSTGASGVLLRNKAIQVIYGPQVSIIKANLEEYIADEASTAGLDSHVDHDILEETIPDYAFDEEVVSKMPNMEYGMRCDMVIPVNGVLKCIDKSQDPAFASKMMGDGYIIEPTDNFIYSPVSGTVVTVFDTLHAIGIRSSDGDEILIHIGLDTVNLKGEGFNVLVKEGEQVVMGQKIAEVDFDFLREQGYPTEVIFVYTNDLDRVINVQEGDVKVGDQESVVVKQRGPEGK